MLKGLLGLVKQSGVISPEGTLDVLDIDQIRGSHAVVISRRANLFKADAPTFENHVQPFRHYCEQVSQAPDLALSVQGDIQATHELVFTFFAQIFYVLFHQWHMFGRTLFCAAEYAFQDSTSEFLGNGQT
jgi:hypothetical protein